MSIEVSHLTKQFGEQKAVNDISFTVSSGEIAGFLGPNGAGKSTTMKMITGYLAPDQGTIKVCGIPVIKENTETKKKIGYLPESNPLYYDMYVREYLGVMAAIHKVLQPVKAIESVIQTVGLSPESHKTIGQLSKGYKQRVGLAAALVHDPEVLILDEPTSGLDPNQIMEIRDVIRRLATQKTILFSSHILQEVEALCHRVIIINQGRIVADETLKELQKKSSTETALLVVFQQNTDEAWIRAISTVTHVRKLKEGHFQIESGQPDLVKKEILRLSIERNLDIVSLQQETQNLEQIFKSFTR